MKDKFILTINLVLSLTIPRPAFVLHFLPFNLYQQLITNNASRYAF
ncbi:MAG: hypothetical protein ACAF41_11505 [Leptolyngbya sp. BL-A-14]